MKMINISTKTAFIINAITSFVLSILFSIYLSMQIIQVDAFEKIGFFRTAIFVFPACFIRFFL